MAHWEPGTGSTVYRFEKHHMGAVVEDVEIEVFDNGEVEARATETLSPTTDSVQVGSIEAGLTYAREQWGLESDALPEFPTVRVNRLVLSLLADHVGTEVVFGHDVPAETRDALAAAYESLDEPGLPMSFHDCPHDGAALDRVPDDPDHPPHVDLLRCPECGEEYILNRDSGRLNIRF